MNWHELCATDPALVPGPISPRRRQVLDLLCAGEPYKRISATLDISERTVRWHVEQMCVAYDVSGRVGLITYAMRRGLTTESVAAPAFVGADTDLDVGR